MTVGLVCAVLAAVCYGVASVLQAVAALRTPAGRRLDARLLVRLATQWVYLVGLGLDLVGFGFDVVALHTLPLFLVQSIIAGSVGVTAVVAAVVLHVRLRRAEVAALVVLLLGLVLLAAAAQPGAATPLSRAARWVLLATVAVVAAAAAGAIRLRRSAAAALAALAGVSFGGAGVAARGLDVPDPAWHLVADPAAWALVGFGVLGTLLFAAALQRGSVTNVSAVTFVVETVLPSAVGFALLGDTTRSGAGVVVAGVGFVLALGAAITLAPYAEPAGAAQHA